MIWLIGCKSLLGVELAHQFELNKIPFVVTDKELDITDITALEDFEKKIERNSYLNYEAKDRHIRWIINCATYLEPIGEDSEENIKEYQRINVNGTLNISRVSRKIGAKLIHISNNYVFDGLSTEVYTEDSIKNPMGAFSKSISTGEDLVQKEMNQYYIIRTSWLYGKDGELPTDVDGNILSKLCENRKFEASDSLKITPTSCNELASVITKLIIKTDSAKEFFGRNSAPSFGIYQYTSSGTTTPFQFYTLVHNLAKKYKKLTSECDITKSDKPAHFPPYSVMNSEKLCKELKIKPLKWEASVERFFKEK